MDVDHLCRAFSVTLAYTICNYLLTIHLSMASQLLLPGHFYLLSSYIHLTIITYALFFCLQGKRQKKNRGKCGVSVVSSHDWKLSQGTSTTIWSKFKRGGLERHNAAIMGGTEKVY